MSNPHLPESQVEISPYDWDLHYKTALELTCLERMDMKVDRDQLDTDMLRQLVLKGPHGDAPTDEDARFVNGDLLAAYVPKRLVSLATLICEDVNVTGERADRVARSMESFVSFFPEEKFSKGLHRMADEAEIQIRNLAARIKGFRRIVATSVPEGFGEAALDARQRMVSSLRENFRNHAGHEDPAPLSARLPVLAAEYHHLSVLGLKQACVEKKIAEECLCVAATEKVLRKQFSAASNLDTRVFQGLATASLLNAMSDLEYAASLRNSLYMMDQINRPFFPSVVFTL